MRKTTRHVIHGMAALVVVVLAVGLGANQSRMAEENRTLRVALADATQSAGQQQKESPKVADATSYQKVLDEPLAITASPGGLEYVPAQPLNADDALAAGLANHERILGIFRSFTLLTDKVETSLSESEKAELGNMDPVFQMIGFSNVWTNNGIALRELRFIVARQAYEIALWKYRAGALDQKRMDEATEVYKTTKQEFETFANGTWFAD